MNRHSDAQDLYKTSHLIHCSGVITFFLLAMESIVFFNAQEYRYPVMFVIFIVLAALLALMIYAHYSGLATLKRTEDLFEEVNVLFRDISSEGIRNSSMEILGLEPGFSLSDLVAARKKMAKKYHPDVGGSEDDMKKINSAYTFLKSSM